VVESSVFVTEETVEEGIFAVKERNFAAAAHWLNLTH